MLRPAMVEAMLRREEDLRLCAQTQASFKAARGEANGIFRVVEALQRQVVREFDLPIDVGLQALRRADLWLGEAKAKELSLYRRHNRCRDGPLAVGDPAPFASVPPLLALGAEATSYFSLTELWQLGLPCVLIAGSHS